MQVLHRLLDLPGLHPGWAGWQLFAILHEGSGTMAMRLALQRALVVCALLFAASITLAPGCNVASWGAIQFTIYTGGDNLDGGKSTGAGYLKLNNGQIIG